LPKIILPVLTKDELEAAREACALATEAGRAKTVADKTRDGALAQVFYKMGFQNLDEVKALSPAELSAEIQRRVGKMFRLDADAFAEFALQKTSQGKYPKWKQEFISLNGPAAAAAIEGETGTLYSYSVLPAGQTIPGSASMFVLAPEPQRKSRAAAAK
jgi:hypothetical protein